MNKLMARIVAVVMAIAMLGTVSFAAGYAGGAVTPGVAPNDAEAQETVLVFATKTANDQAYTAGADKIVAIAQEANVPTSIAINPDYIADYDYITIAYGGSDGTVDYAYVDLRGEATLQEIVVADTIVLDGVTYENVAYAKFSFKADGTITKYGIKFNVYDDEGEAVEGAVEKDFSVTATIAAEGQIEYGALILGVPYGELRGTIKAIPYVEYAQN
ncbi:MAG: hypothetical protein IKB32_03980 [Clostridia bacterium]|nr:hypothetical protein [Clostridia bacterium]